MKLTWKDIATDCQRLAIQLKDQKFDGLVAVTRGGLVPAGIMAHILDIKLIDTICVSSYVDTARVQVHVIKLNKDSRRWLILDDLVDTGRTAKIIKDAMPNSVYAVLYAKPQGKKYANAFGREIEQDEWVHFPWEQG